MRHLSRPIAVLTTSLLFAITGVAAEPAAPGTATPAATGPGYHVLKTTVLGGDGGFDLLTMDAASRRLYIARGNRGMVVDPDTGKVLAEIPGKGVHGLAVSTKANRGFMTNGREDSVTTFDLTTLKEVGTAKTGSKPDAVIYDPASDQIYVCNNGGTTLTVLNPADGTVVATIDVGGQPELPTVDGKGHLYVNLEDKSQVAAVDTTTHKATAQWPLAPGEGPTGLAIDIAHHRLFSACRGSKSMEVLDAETGKHLASLPIGNGTVFLNVKYF